MNQKIRGKKRRDGFARPREAGHKVRRRATNRAQRKPK